MGTHLRPLAFFVGLAGYLHRFVLVGFVACCRARQNFLVGGICRFESFARLAGTHLPPISNCLGFLRKSNTELNVTPSAALSIDITAVAISCLRDYWVKTLV